MHPDFWHQRWHEGRIGFHQHGVTPLLERYWRAVDAPAGSRVFVPLCGKTLDMPWLAARGYRVLGIELSQRAVDDFFAEQGLAPAVHDSPLGRHHVAGAIEIIRGDVFDLDAAALADCNALFDRAALIALPADMRQRYARTCALLPAGCRGLLVTLEYPPHEKHGPPFPVPEDEVHALHDDAWAVQRLSRDAILDTQQAFREEGVTTLATCAWRLQRKG